MQGTRGSGVHLGTWGNIELLKETKTEHEKLHRNGNYDSGHVYAGDAVVPTLHTSTRVRGRVRRIISRQTQLLIKNGKMSSGKKTKHIKAKFFFIKDRVDDGEIKVIDCPTEELWADVMTKPLQGTAFRVMRAELMNCDINCEDPPEDDNLGSIPALKTVSWKKDITSYSKAPQECVGQNAKLLPGRETDRRAPKESSRDVKSSRDVICQRTDRRSGRGRPQDLGVVRLQQPSWRGRPTGMGILRQ